MFIEFYLFFPILLISAGRIEQIPGLNFTLYSNHYSGFLNVSKTNRLFYWFVESQNTPSADPIIFWFNGGPGCSSLTGLLREHGPMLINKDGETFRENKYSWSRIASVVYIETPSGVGYSYSTSSNYVTGDYYVAKDNYEAMKQFFKEFPQYRHHNVFLTGESYAGFYVPMLAEQIINGQSQYPIYLKGIAIGNGLINFILMERLRKTSRHSKGFMGFTEYKKFLNNYCEGSLRKCSTLETFDEDLFTEFNDTGIDAYDTKRRCSMNDNCTPYPRSDLEKFFNNKNVRKALNIPHEIRWEDCWSIDDVMVRYERTDEEMTSQILRAVKNKVRTLLYYGDADLICSFMVGQSFAAKLGIKKVAEKSPWFFNNTLGGYKTVYDGLTVLTVRGAGHSAPETHPAKMFDVIQKFIEDQPF